MAMQVKYGSSQSFYALEKADLKPTAVIAQCLDNQWVPSGLLRRIARQKRVASLDDVKFALKAWRFGIGSLDLESHRKSEYYRSLIAAEQVIINRAFMVNNKTIYDDFSSSSDDRDSFIALTSTGGIVPYFFKEDTPLGMTEKTEESAFSMSNEGAEAWRRVCHEAEPHCIKLSWNKKTNDEEIQELLSRQFYRRLAPLCVGDPAIYLRNLRGLESHIGPEEARAFTLRLQEFRDDMNRIFDQGSLPTREEIYQRYVLLKGTTPTERVYDGTRPFMVEIKQLVDLVYNTNLSDALQVLTLTPSDSPTRLALQELSSRPTVQAIEPGQLYQIMRDLRFAIVQTAIDFIDFGALSLRDIVAIRATQEWFAYKTTLEAVIANTELLNSTSDFMDERRGLPALEQSYQALLGMISRQYVGATATKKSVTLGVKLTIQVGAQFLISLWTQGTSPLLQFGAGAAGELLGRGLAQEAAEVITNVSIGWVQGTSTDLIGAVSIQLSRRQFKNARKAWDDLSARLRDPNASPFKLFTDDSVDLEPVTINQQISGE